MPKFDINKFMDQTIETSISPDAIPDGVETDSATIEVLFEQAYLHSSSDFLDNLYSWWEDKGFLTERQYLKLMEIADR